MSTKKELEDEIKVLKDKIRSLQSEVKSVSTEGLTEDAYALCKEGKDFKLVKVLFNPETRNAEVSDIEDLGNSLAMASFRIKKAVIDRLVKIKGK